MRLPLEENKTVGFPSQWGSCTFWVDDKHVEECCGPGCFSRVPHLCGLINFCNISTMFLQNWTISSWLCAELCLFRFLSECSTSLYSAKLFKTHKRLFLLLLVFPEECLQSSDMTGVRNQIWILSKPYTGKAWLLQNTTNITYWNIISFAF